MPFPDNPLPWGALGLAACLFFGGDAPAAALQVPGNGKVYLEGRRFAGIGVNYFSAFTRHLKNPADTSYRKGFRELGALSIPFARMPIIGYWPKDNDLYFRDKARYFALLDDVVRSAAANRVALIFSFFWEAHFLVPDMVDEPGKAWADTGSKTHAFMRAFVAEVSSRYNDHPWVWAYEFANEYNLKCDLPNAAEHRPPIQTDLGTPPSRSADDDQTYAIMSTALTAFAGEVRRTEPGRLVLSGNGLPRAYAWHNLNGKTWQADTRAQFGEMLLVQNPAPLNSFTVHVYETEGYFADGAASLETVIHACDSMSRKADRVLFMGEFGASATLEEPRQRQLFEAYMRAILRDTLPLSAAWVYDLPAQEGEWNFTLDNQRRWMLDEIRRVNSVLSERTKGAQQLVLRHGFASPWRLSLADRRPVFLPTGRRLEAEKRIRIPVPVFDPGRGSARPWGGLSD